MAKKVPTGNKTPLQLAQAARKEVSARIAKLSPEQRTKEIAPTIVTRAIHAIRKVGVLGSAKTVEEVGDEKIYRKKYELTNEQVDRIVATLKHEVEVLRDRLVPGEKEGKKKTEFTF